MQMRDQANYDLQRVQITMYSKINNHGRFLDTLKRIRSNFLTIPSYLQENPHQIQIQDKALKAPDSRKFQEAMLEKSTCLSRKGTET
jgi:hypothetical protein